MDKTTLTQRIYEEIKQAIVLNNFKEGEKLTEEGLSKKLNTSRTPVRSALKRLQYENLIVKDDVLRGLIVSHISEEDIKEILPIRENISELIIEQLQGKITKDEIEILETFLDIQKSSVENKDYIKFVEMEFNFHLHLAKFTKNKFLFNIVEKIETNIQRYLILSGSLNKHSMIALEEHLKVIKNLKEGNFIEAKISIKNHIINSLNRMFV